MERKKVRILCLHGWNANKEVTIHQLKVLSKPTADIAEYVAINGPFETEKQVDPMLAARFKGPFYSWTDMNRLKKEGNVGIRQAIAQIAKIWHDQGPFHGILGFSQGSSMLRIILLLLSQGEVTFDPPIKFLIQLSSPYFNRKVPDFSNEPVNGIVSLPTFAIFGVKDYLFEQTKFSLSKLVRPQVLIHSKAHQLPKEITPEVIRRFRHFLLQHSDLPPPKL